MLARAARGLRRGLQGGARRHEPAPLLERLGELLDREHDAIATLDIERSPRSSASGRTARALVALTPATRSSRGSSARARNEQAAEAASRRLGGGSPPRPRPARSRVPPPPGAAAAARARSGGLSMVDFSSSDHLHRHLLGHRHRLDRDAADVVESQPKTLLKQQQAVTNCRTPTTPHISTKLFTLKSAADALRSFTLYAGSPTATSADPSKLTAAATSAAAASSYNVASRTSPARRSSSRRRRPRSRSSERSTPATAPMRRAPPSSPT